MADPEDLKSSEDFSSCGFDSLPGHHSTPGLPIVLLQQFFPDVRLFFIIRGVSMAEIMAIVSPFGIELGLVRDSFLFKSFEGKLFVAIVVDIVPFEDGRSFPTANRHDRILAAAGAP